MTRQLSGRLTLLSIALGTVSLSAHAYAAETMQADTGGTTMDMPVAASPAAAEDEPYEFTLGEASSPATARARRSRSQPIRAGRASPSLRPTARAT